MKSVQLFKNLAMSLFFPFLGVFFLFDAGIYLTLINVVAGSVVEP
jgi:hypothetical protein